MLDAATMALLAKVKMLAKKVGVNVDLVRIGNERSYAEAILQELGNANEPELVLIELMNQLGLIGNQNVETKQENGKDAGRYVGLLR